MDKTNQFFLELSFDNLRREVNWDSLFPIIGLPKKVYQRKWDKLLFGYFSNFDGLVNEKEIFDEVEKNGFKKLTNSNSLFLLLFIDLISGNVAIAVDQFLSFSCFFAILEDKLIISSSFGRMKNELKKSKSLKTDTDAILSYLLWEWHNAENTLVKQIKVLPGGSQLRLNLKDLKGLQVGTLIELNNFYDKDEGQEYQSMEDFSKAWLELLMQLVEERLRLIPDEVNIGCDVSSGFDCALIAFCLSQISRKGRFKGFSNYSSIMGDENNLDIVKRFANIHNFPLEVFDYTKHTLHELNPDEAWPSDTLVNPFVYVHHSQYINFLNKNDIRLLFTGEYGDESYDTKQMEILSRFPIQRSYFDSIASYRRRRKQELFVDSAKDLFLDQTRFKKRGFYPLIIPSKSAGCYLPVVEAYSNNCINRLNIFSDTRLLSLARRAPLKEGQQSFQIKELMMPFFKSIMPENYISTSNAGEPFVQLFVNQKNFVLRILDHSILEQYGLIDAEFLKKYVNNSNSEIYTDKSCQMAMLLYQIVYLDWYLQKNQIV